MDILLFKKIKKKGFNKKQDYCIAIIFFYIIINRNLFVNCNEEEYILVV